MDQGGPAGSLSSGGGGGGGHVRRLRTLKRRKEEKREAKNKARELGQPRTGHYNEDYCWQTSDGFDWLKYLEWTSSKAAPVTFFKPDPFPSAHRFTKLLKLEAVDPLNQSCICVVTVAEVVGPRLRLHFDGYSDSYDFWENCNSENLFPVGWCSKNNQRLVPPKGIFISLYLYRSVSIIKGYSDNIVWSAKLCNRIIFATLRVKLIREIRRMIMKLQFKPYVYCLICRQRT